MQLPYNLCLHQNKSVMLTQYKYQSFIYSGFIFHMANMLMHKKLIIFYVCIHICFVSCMCHIFEKGDAQQSLWFLSWEYVPINFFLSCQTAEKISNCATSVNFINFSSFGVHYFFMLLSLKGLKAWVFKCGSLKSSVLNTDVKLIFFFLKQQTNSKTKSPEQIKSMQPNKKHY